MKCESVTLISRPTYSETIVYGGNRKTAPDRPLPRVFFNRDLLRSRLLSHVNFGKFPPPTMHVAGWPWQLWEALISHIDAKTQLYFLCHGGSYNVRAFSSLIGETFFSELSLHDKTGCGTVSAEEFGRFIGTATEQLHVRLNPNR